MHWVALGSYGWHVHVWVNGQNLSARDRVFTPPRCLESMNKAALDRLMCASQTPYNVWLVHGNGCNGSTPLLGRVDSNQCRTYTLSLLCSPSMHVRSMAVHKCSTQLTQSGSPVCWTSACAGTVNLLEHELPQHVMTWHWDWQSRQHPGLVPSCQARRQDPSSWSSPSSPGCQQMCQPS